MNPDPDNCLSPAKRCWAFLPPHPLALNPTEHIWEEIHETIFKNCAAKVCDKLAETSLYIERYPKTVKSMTSFPYIMNLTVIRQWSWGSASRFAAFAIIGADRAGLGRYGTRAKQTLASNAIDHPKPKRRSTDQASVLSVRSAASRRRKSAPHS